MPEGIPLDNAESLGLRLVSALSDQLQATAQLDRTPGTRFTLRFRPLLAIRNGVGSLHSASATADASSFVDRRS